MLGYTGMAELPVSGRGPGSCHEVVASAWNKWVREVGAEDIEQEIVEAVVVAEVQANTSAHPRRLPNARDVTQAIPNDEREEPDTLTESPAPPPPPDPQVLSQYGQTMSALVPPQGTPPQADDEEVCGQR